MKVTAARNTAPPSPLPYKSSNSDAGHLRMRPWYCSGPAKGGYTAPGKSTLSTKPYLEYKLVYATPEQSTECCRRLWCGSGVRIIVLVCCNSHRVGPGLDNALQPAHRSIDSQSNGYQAVTAFGWITSQNARAAPMAVSWAAACFRGAPSASSASGSNS